MIVASPRSATRVDRATPSSTLFDGDRSIAPPARTANHDLGAARDVRTAEIHDTYPAAHRTSAGVTRCRGSPCTRRGRAPAASGTSPWHFCGVNTRITREHGGDGTPIEDRRGVAGTARVGAMSSGARWPERAVPDGAAQTRSCGDRYLKCECLASCISGSSPGGAAVPHPVSGVRVDVSSPPAVPRRGGGAWSLLTSSQPRRWRPATAGTDPVSHCCGVASGRG